MIEQILLDFAGDIAVIGYKDGWNGLVKERAIQILESLASKGEIREQVEEFLEQYRFGTMRKGDWLTTTEALNKILSIVNADKELALREQAEKFQSIIYKISTDDLVPVRATFLYHTNDTQQSLLKEGWWNGAKAQARHIREKVEQAFKKQVLEQGE